MIYICVGYAVKKRVITISISVLFVLAVAVFALYWGVIFQRGNPIPYLSKMRRLNKGNPYAKVFTDKNTYISRIGEWEQKLTKHIEETYSVKFIEQMGSVYRFESKEKLLLASSEIYWKNYLVWDLSISDNVPPVPPPALPEPPDKRNAEQTVRDYLLVDGADIKECNELGQYYFEGTEYQEWYVRFRGASPDATADADGVYTLCRTADSVWIIYDIMHVEQYTTGEYPSMIESAKSIALAYYGNAEITLVPVFDQNRYSGFFHERIQPELVQGALFAFDVIKAESTEPRVIILAKMQGGEWEIIYEG